MRKSAAVILFLLSLHSFCGDTTKILFIGNSYTYVNDLPLLFKQLSASGGKNVYTDVSAPGGYTLEGHYSLPETIDKINSGGWKYVVLQEQSQYPVIEYYRTGSMYPFAAKLDSIIRANGSETMFYMTWGRKFGGQQCIGSYCSPVFADYFHMQDSLQTAYGNLSALLSAELVPVGLAWKRALLQQPGIELWDTDGSHPSLKGSYLAACMFYTAVFGESPEGLNYFGGLDSTDALNLQQIAGSFLTGIGISNNNIPSNVSLEQNYPNPFNPSTTIRFKLGRAGKIVIKLFDAAGREIRVLVNSYYMAGSHMLRIDAIDLPSGVYFCSLTSGSNSVSTKMVLLK